MTIKNEVRELSRNLAKLGLEQILLEESLADDSFRVVYVNKQIAQQAEKPDQRKQQDDITSL